jgi:hypothetical protein
VSVAATAGTLALASSAPAAIYRVAQCDPGVGAGHPDADFQRTANDFQSAAACANHDDKGLAVSVDGRTRSGRWGAWTLSAPSGTSLTGGELRVSGQDDDGLVPELLLGSGATLSPFGDATGPLHRVAWDGGQNDILQAALRCEHSVMCRNGKNARIRVRDLSLKLRDQAKPKARARGSIFGHGSQRGAQTALAKASDAGGGVHRVFVEVNGRPVDARNSDCAVSDQVALRMRPCPRNIEQSFAMDTAAKPFRQGPNHVRVCAADYGPGSAGNRDCATRRVHIDNRCPISSVDTGKRLRSHLRGATVRGRLVDQDGHGVGNAEVCVATRLPLGGAAEHVVATPRTTKSGHFSVHLHRGPSRIVRTAYWANDSKSLEKTKRLRVHARPRLNLSPDRVLHNGQRVHFHVHLPGPRNGGKSVTLKVDAGNRWLPLRRGRTNKHGTWTSQYRFHATTGRQTYRFRAFMPKQRGYPYESGNSRVKRQTVVGG